MSSNFILTASAPIIVDAICLPLPVVPAARNYYLLLLFFIDFNPSCVSFDLGYLLF